MLFPTSSQSWMGILHTHSRRGPHGGPKITRDTPKIAAICFVFLLMLVYNPPTKISSCRAVFCYTLPHLSLGWAYRTTYGHWGSQSGPQMTRDTPKVAAFCFDSLLALACDPPIKISLCRAVFCCFLPHLNLRWAYCTYMVIGVELRGFVDTVTSQASFCLAMTSGFNGFDKRKYLVLTFS